jgi:hypothetical protein
MISTENSTCPISFSEHINTFGGLELAMQTHDIEIALRSVVGQPEEEQLNIVEPLAKIVLEQTLQLYKLTPKFKQSFPESDYKLTLFEKCNIYDLIRMYQTAGKDFNTREKHKHTIQSAIQSNLIKTSLPQKLERIEWDFGKLKDLIRFTIEKENFGTIDSLVQDSVKLSDILASIGYEVHEVDAKFDIGTKYSDITLQFINKNQPTALNPNGTIIEVKFQSKVGMKAKKQEDPIYHERRDLAKKIRQGCRSKKNFDDFIVPAKDETFRLKTLNFS